jgi:hypothetical protein
VFSQLFKGMKQVEHDSEIHGCYPFHHIYNNKIALNLFNKERRLADIE